MNGPAWETLNQFGSVEDDQRYTRLVDLFADDGVYYDPFFGAQRGKAAIQTFMEHMEEMVPKSGATFASWTTVADTDCGWAVWDMVVPNADGEPTPIPGQSLYRLRDGKVTFVADYLDTKAYRGLRGPDANSPDHKGSIGLSASPDNPVGPARDTIERFWEIQNSARYSDLAELFTDDARFSDPIDGEFVGRDAIAAFFTKMETDMPEIGATFELVDAAGDDTVGWSQWYCRFPNGIVPGWTMHTFRDGKITLDHDEFDANIAHALTKK